jgi:hypothetical protein
MSFDLYLLPLNSADDADTVMQLFEQSETGEPDGIQASVDVRTAGNVLRTLEPRYEPFDVDYAEIARSENISTEEAKAKYSYNEMNGPEDAKPPLAQFIFYPNYVIVHWYSGTSEPDMFRYLKGICKYAQLSLFDPQDEKIYRLDSRGEFK